MGGVKLIGNLMGRQNVE